MSLLNDMLRDLVKKQQTTADSSTYEQVIRREGVQLEDSALTRFTKVSLFFIVIFTLVLLIKNLVTHYDFYLKAQKPSAEQINNTNQKVKSVPKTLPPSKTLPTNKSIEALHQEPEMAETSLQDSQVLNKAKIGSVDIAGTKTNTLDEVTQEKIDSLLIHAKFAISQDRLTSPIEDNAFSDYQRILQIDPSNGEAKQGIEFIASRYVARAQEQLKLGNTQQAQSYFQRAEFVAPDYFQSQMETASGVVNELRSMQPNLTNSMSNELPKEIDTKSKLTSSDSKSEAKTLSTVVVADVKSTLGAERLESQHLEIAPTNKWQDEDAARIARDLINQRQVAEAKTLLEKTLAVHFESPRSVVLLHELYLKESNSVAADNLTNRADFLAEDQRNLLRAQSLVVQTKVPEAIQILEQHLASAESNEAYRALLASLYHQSGKYSASVNHYQQLVNRFGDKPAYWLGLALGYDGLAQPKNAEQCYQHLKKFSQLQPQVLAYVDKRLAALQLN